MTLNNSMSITPSPPGHAKGERFEHGSVLGGKTRAARVTSQWKSTRYSAWTMGQRALEPRPSQRCDRRLCQQAGENRLGGAAARRTVRRHRSGGVEELGRSRSKRPSVNRGLREGDDGMARQSNGASEARATLPPYSPLAI